VPEIKLSIGKMELEENPTSKDETVAAILYNAYRVGKSFHRAPGLTHFADSGTNLPVYGYYSKLHNICLAVVGTKLYSVSRDGVMTEVTGGAFTASTPASFAEDSTRILIVANSSIHVYTVASGVLTILAGQSPIGVTSISILRGFLIANGLDGAGGGIAGDFGWSNDASYAVWAYENNAARPDALQSILTTPNDDIFFIGSETIEVNNLSGDVASPFYVNKSASLAYGTPAPYSVSYDGQNVYMVAVIGGNRQLLRLMGGRTPQLIGFPVSTPLDDIDDISDLQCFMLGARGRTFYIVTCPTASINIEDEVQSGFTLAFDIRTEEWHIWGDWNSQAGEYNAYRGRSFAYAESWGNKRMEGGDDGKIYLLDDSHTYGSDVIRMALRMGWRSNGTMKWKTCKEYLYDFKAGVGNSTVTSPVFIHRWRNNGNLEWNNPRQVNMGAVGQRGIPQKSRQCGRYRTRQDELVFADAVEIVFNGIYEEVERER
jgi:hypothetical protein